MDGRYASLGPPSISSLGAGVYVPSSIGGSGFTVDSLPQQEYQVQIKYGIPHDITYAPANTETMSMTATTPASSNSMLISQMQLQNQVFQSQSRLDTVSFGQPHAQLLDLPSPSLHFPADTNDNTVWHDARIQHTSALPAVPNSTNALLRYLEEDAIRTAMEGSQLAKIIEHIQIIHAFACRYTAADLITPLEYNEMAKRASITFELISQLAKQVGVFLSPDDLLGPILNDSKHADCFENRSQSTYKRKARRPTPEACRSCNTRDTPEWRYGPGGARTLCNACGLYYSKLRRVRGDHISIEMLRAFKAARDFTL